MSKLNTETDQNDIGNESVDFIHFLAYQSVDLLLSLFVSKKFACRTQHEMNLYRTEVDTLCSIDEYECNTYTQREYTSNETMSMSIFRPSYT